MATKSLTIPEEVQDWLLDPAEPGPRYLAIKYLAKNPPQDLPAACEDAHTSGPINAILEEMHPDGYWENDGPGYLPKYRSSAWSILLLSQLGASAKQDARIHLACEQYLDRAMSEGGQISTNGPPSGTVDCLQGNILAALTLLEYQDPRLEAGFEWMARTVTGAGMAPAGQKKAPRRYYAGKIGPDFQCGANNKLACAWGAVKVMLAFSLLKPAERTPLIDQAIQHGVNFLFSCDPATADYPTGWTSKPSRNWWKFGFPVFYVTDLLQVCQVMANLGLSGDPRLENALQIVQEKGYQDGRWQLEYGYQGKTWVDLGQLKEPSKWVTIRAYSALGAVLAD